ncbi:MAG: RpiB/LacA/LacB family sugar-phosphate isomerase [Myxococcales bacterium]|jgi:ribose 5-phosphate isomerase B|nr:RpiB/LacA/LacB family sugar-phosphate isomerase [Myxococcales bacterium]
MISQLGSHEGKKIIFGFDHHLAPKLEAYLAVLGHHGPVVPTVHSETPHYLSSAELVCERVRGRSDLVGVLICSTGIGISIAANKFSGIYAARCLTADDAELCRTINNANVLCLSMRATLAVNAQIIDSFMTTPYEGRKLDQLSRITRFEQELELPQTPARARFKSV